MPFTETARTTSARGFPDTTPSVDLTVQYRRRSGGRLPTDNREGHILKLVHEWQVALPLRPDLGCEPNVFYIPPLSPAAFDEQGEFDDEASRIPMEYLREMFGPGVDAALETLKTERAKVADGGSSEMIDILIARRWQDLMGPFTEDPAKLSRPPPPA